MNRTGRKPRHGHARRGSESGTYRTWKNMIGRCESPNRHDFLRYGGAGVRVCEAWHVFDAFLEHMGERPKGGTLDRIDNSKGYEPGNCRWATVKEQNRNQRSNRFVTAYGETKTLAEWAESRGFVYMTLFNRIVRHGWSPEEALTRPVRPWGDRPRKAALLKG